jgi:vesicle transport through interaction with t-SNAREs protein 1
MKMGNNSTRAKLMASNQKLDQSTELLQQSKRLVGETEQIGDTIISDLEAQKEKIYMAQENVEDTKQYTVDARALLRMMSTRNVIHKLCVYGTIVILAAIIGAIGYFGFGNN